MSNSPENMQGQVEEKELPKLSISCAKELFAALRSKEWGTRLSVLSKISQAPEKALSYGPHNGRDLLDEIFEQLTAIDNSTLRQALLAAVAGFRDARVVESFKILFGTCNNNQEIEICGWRLAREPGLELKEYFSKYLGSNQRTLQARHAANILTKVDGHSPENSVRIAVLCNVDFSTPPLNDDTEMAWLKELQGAEPYTAKVLMESLGEAAFSRLRQKWDYLSVDLKIWLLEWGGRDHQAMTVELCLKALEEGAEELILAALKAIANFRAMQELFRSATTKLLQDPRSKIRLAALQAGAEVVDPRADLERESDIGIRLLIIPHLIKVYGEESPADLIHLIEDKDWRIRNVATTALKSLGSLAIPAVEKCLNHKMMEVRTAATQVLLAAEA